MLKISFGTKNKPAILSEATSVERSREMWEISNLKRQKPAFQLLQPGYVPMVFRVYDMDGPPSVEPMVPSVPRVPNWLKLLGP